MRAPHQTVRVMYITPGGVEGRGGMGRMARYFLAAFRCLPDLEVRVLDPYGPGTFWKMPFYFLGSLVSLSVACARGRVDVTHIHMSFGGSAVRKLALMRVAGFFQCANNSARSWFRVCCLRRSVKSPLTWNTG